MPFEQVCYMFASDTPQDDLLFKVYIRNILALFKLWELYYIQARNSKQLTELYSVSSSVRAKAQTDGISFSYNLLESSRQWSAVFVSSILL